MLASNLSIPFDVKQRQSPLRKKYAAKPESAIVIDRAVSKTNNINDPFHAKVNPMPDSGEVLPVGVHAALGGFHDAPTPGDILCAALASCLDSALRIVANSMSVRLCHLQVDVSAEVDVRGTLMINPKVPVGFQRVNCHVSLIADEGVDQSTIDRLVQVAEHCCVVMQTLKTSPIIETVYNFTDQ